MRLEMRSMINRTRSWAKSQISYNWPNHFQSTKKVTQLTEQNNVMELPSSIIWKLLQFGLIARLVS